MAKKRVHEIAKEQGLTSKELIAKLQAAGIEVKAAASSVEEAEALKALGGNGAAPKAEAPPAEPEAAAPSGDGQPTAPEAAPTGRRARRNSRSSARPATRWPASARPAPAADAAVS